MKLRNTANALAILLSFGMVSTSWAACESVNPDVETKTVSFTYDVNDMLLAETIEPDATGDCANRLKLETTHKYDALGNRYMTYGRGWDGQGVTNRVNVIQFDSVGRFVVSKYSTDDVTITPTAVPPTNVALIEKFVIDGRTGEVFKKTGANDDWTQFDYDLYGRKVRVSSSNGSFEDLSYKTFQTFDIALPPNVGTRSWDIYTPPPPDYGATKPAWKVSATSISGGTTIKPAKTTYFDGAGREIASETQHLVSGTYTYVQQHYNAFGQVVRLSKPQFVGQAPAYWVEYDYDGNGRLFRERLPDSNGHLVISSFFYEGRITYKYDPLGSFKVMTTNERGEVISNMSPLGAYLQYLYSASGNLVATVDPYGSRTSVTYDIRGRKTQMSDPNKGTWYYGYNAFGELIEQTDPNSRVAKNVYDKYGRLIQKTYAEAPSTAEATMDARWAYGDATPSPCLNGKGRLCYAYTVSGTAGSIDPQNGITGNAAIQYVRKHTYAQSGEVAQTETKIGDSRVFATNSAFDGFGRLTELKYPSLSPTNSSGKRLGLSYSYENGYLKSINGFDTNTGSGSWRVWQVNAAAADLQATNETLGPDSGSGVNPVTVVSTPDVSNGRIISRLISNSAGTMLDQLEYVYDVVGNLSERKRRNAAANASPTAPLLSEIFEHDALERLVGWTYVQNGISKSVGLEYLANGNIHFKSDIGYYAYGPNNGVPDPNTGKPHAVKSVFNGPWGNRTFSYDPSGNMTTQVGTSTRTLEYTSWAMVQKIQVTGDGPTRTSEFAFGPEFQRVKQTSSSQGTTLYLNGSDSLGLSFEQVTDLNNVVSYKHYVQASGRAALVITIPQTNPQGDIASSPGNRFEYLHYDHLGSLVMTTGKDGTAYEKFFWDPWGKRLNVNTGANFGEYQNRPILNGVSAIASMDRGFTMHEHLDELGYVHMNGRIYDPSLGRFPQADPFVPDSTHLQAFNRYSYVYNNPLRYSDPTGYKPFWQMMWFKNLTREVSPIASMAVSIYMPGAMESALMETFGELSEFATGAKTLSTAGKVIVGASTAATATLIASGGNVEASLKASLTGGLFGFVGGVGAANGWMFDGATGAAKYVLSHAVVGCLDGALNHSGCGRGAVSAAFGKFVTLNTGTWGTAGQGVATVIAGGVTSVIGGGKFGNGARTALMGYLFNCSMSRDCRQHSTAVVDSNTQAVSHYQTGAGLDAELGPRSKEAAILNPRMQEAMARLEAGVAAPDGKFDIDLTKDVFHVGRTKVWYSTVCSQSCTTTFSVFGYDRFEDPLSIGQTFGRAPFEVLGGTAYRYKPFNFTFSYPNPSSEKKP